MPRHWNEGRWSGTWTRATLRRTEVQNLALSKKLVLNFLAVLTGTAINYDIGNWNDCTCYYRKGDQIIIVIQNLQWWSIIQSHRTYDFKRFRVSIKSVSEGAQFASIYRNINVGFPFLVHANAKILHLNKQVLLPLQFLAVHSKSFPLTIQYHITTKDVLL
jgi:hypothetical protein